MFGGMIDEVSIYNRALSAGEIATNTDASAAASAPRIQCLPHSIATTINTPISFAASRLALNDIELDGYTLSVTAVAPGSVQGGAITLASGIVTYKPPPNFAGIDSFLYTVSDGYGGSASGTVTVAVGSAQVPSQDLLLNPRIVGGNLMFEFTSIPGLAYTIQSAPSPDGPWTTVNNLTSPLTNQGLGAGVFHFLAPSTNGIQFYRTVHSAP
jgi:hypothetical protein